MAANKLWALEFLHVAAGALWASIDLFLGLVLVRSSVAWRSRVASS